MHAESIRNWLRQAEIDGGKATGLTTEERQRIKELERENFELRRANEILKSAAAFSGRSSTADRSGEPFIDAHRCDYGVEPICEVLQVAPSTYYAARKRPPCRRRRATRSSGPTSPGCSTTRRRSPGSRARRQQPERGTGTRARLSTRFPSTGPERRSVVFSGASRSPFRVVFQHATTRRDLASGNVPVDVDISGDRKAKRSRLRRRKRQDTKKEGQAMAVVVSTLGGGETKVEDDELERAPCRASGRRAHTGRRRL